MKFLFAALVFIAGVFAQDVEKTVGGVTVKFQGSSGGMTLISDTGTVKVKQAKLEEKDKNGKTVKSVNVAGQNSWSAVTEKDGLYTTTFSVNEKGRRLDLEVYFSETDKPATVGVDCTCTDGAGDCVDDNGHCTDSAANECPTDHKRCTKDVSVKQGNIEFVVRVTGWQFQDKANTLEYGVEVDAGVATSDVKQAEGQTEYTVNFGDASISAEKKATVAGSEVEQTTGYPKLESAGGKRQALTWSFPSFDETATLVYDPSIASSSSWIVPSFALLALICAL